MTHDDDSSRLIDSLEDALEAEHAARLDAERQRDTRIEAARHVVDRLRENLEAEHSEFLRMEAERDALLDLMVGPGVGLHAGCWELTSPAQADATLPCVWPTREAAVRAVYRAAGVEG